MFDYMPMHECRDKVLTAMQSGLPMTSRKVLDQVEKRFGVNIPIAFVTTAICSLCKSGEIERDRSKASPIFKLLITTEGREAA